jgi:hypothetical protein
LLKFNLVIDKVANSVQLSKNTMVKASPWTWHLRLGHCRPIRCLENNQMQDLRYLQNV